jgi:hypothetical protein
LVVDAIPPLQGERGWRTEHGSGLGRFRGVVERTFAWLNQFRLALLRPEIVMLTLSLVAIVLERHVDNRAA